MNSSPKTQLPNDIKIFENSIIKKCFNLRLLSIKNYRMIQLKDNIFSRLNKLEKLELVNVNLRKIDHMAFYGLEMSLLELNLDSNMLDSLPSNALGALKRLRKLTLSQNRIKQIQANAFFKISSSLNTLDLSYNYLEKLDENSFNGPIQNSLKTLFIQNNELKWSHYVQILFNLHQLLELNIDFNKLSIRSSHDNANSFIESYSEIPLNLVSLSMQGNSLTEKSLTDFDNLFDFDDSLAILSSNLKIKFEYQKLSKLNLARNKIKYIPENFFFKMNASQLKVLILDRNTFDPKEFRLKSFSGLEKSLETLSLNSVGFSFWSSNFVTSLNKLSNLKSLKLSSNNAIDSGIETVVLKNLTSIELQNNNFRNFPRFLCDLENLVDLDLSSNKIENLESNCPLFNLGESKSKLRNLNLNNNPLDCDCQMRELKLWFTHNYNRDLLELIKWKCNKPLRLQGKILVNVGLEELICVDETPIRTEPPILVTQSEEIKTTTMATFLKIDVTTNKDVIEPIPFNYTNKFLNVFTLFIITITFGMLFIVVLILIAFYFISCFGRRLAKKQEKYVKQFIENNNPQLSFSNSSATSVASVYTKSSTDDLVNIFGSEYFSFVPNKFYQRDVSTSKLSSHLRFYESPVNDANTCLSSRDLVDKDHVYHEIYNANNQLNDDQVFYLKNNNHFNNNRDYESSYNSLIFFANNNNNNNNQNFSKLNCFDKGLIV